MYLSNGSARFEPVDVDAIEQFCLLKTLASSAIRKPSSKIFYKWKKDNDIGINETS